MITSYSLIRKEFITMVVCLSNFEKSDTKALLTRTDKGKSWLNDTADHKEFRSPELKGYGALETYKAGVVLKLIGKGFNEVKPDEEQQTDIAISDSWYDIVKGATKWLFITIGMVYKPTFKEPTTMKVSEAFGESKALNTKEEFQQVNSSDSDKKSKANHLLLFTF